MIRLAVMILVAVVVMSELPSKAVAEENSKEQRPKTSAWHQRTASSSGVKPSYDLSEAYNVMAANRMGVGSGFSNGGSSRVGGTSKSSRDAYDSLDAGDSPSHYYESYSQPSGYGSYASESGYGLSCASGYVNASAVALLAFLFLLNIVQDVVQQITGSRKRRSAEDDDQEDVFTFVSSGGLGAMKEELPRVVLPLMVDLLDATEAPPECLQRPLCEANAQLSSRFGVAGSVVGSLLSNVVSKAFSGDHIPKFHLGLQASSAGRNGHNCSARFRKCSSGHKYFNEANESRQEAIDAALHSQQENRLLDNSVS